MFRRFTGATLENFLILQRVELAKRTLLDLRLNVAEVAERCGFCSPAYFASVFKKYMHCTPREYASDPYRYAESHFGKSEPVSVPIAAISVAPHSSAPKNTRELIRHEN